MKIDNIWQTLIPYLPKIILGIFLLIIVLAVVAGLTWLAFSGTEDRGMRRRWVLISIGSAPILILSGAVFIGFCRLLWNLSTYLQSHTARTEESTITQMTRPSGVPRESRDLPPQRLVESFITNAQMPIAVIMTNSISVSVNVGISEREQRETPSSMQVGVVITNLPPAPAAPTRERPAEESRGRERERSGTTLPSEQIEITKGISVSEDGQWKDVDITLLFEIPRGMPPEDRQVLAEEICSLIEKLRVHRRGELVRLSHPRHRADEERFRTMVLDYLKTEWGAFLREKNLYLANAWYRLH